MNIDPDAIRCMTDLPKLPWFEEQDGHIALKDDAGVPPVLDAHTHLGWSFGFSREIDMDAPVQPVNYFFDYFRDQNLLGEERHPWPDEGADFTAALVGAAMPGQAMNASHTARNQRDEMDRLGHRLAVSLPIVNVALPRHAEQTLAGCELFRGRFIPFAAVQIHPWSGKQEQRLAQLVEAGAKGVKYHPEFQFLPPEHPDSMRMFAWCEAHELPLLTHVGYTGAEPKWLRRMAEPERFIPALEAFPKLKLILGHTGLIRREATLAVAKQFEDQVWLETSGQAVPGLTEIFNQFDKARICYGTDWPFAPLAAVLARALIATEDAPDYRADFFYNNAARVLGLETV